MVLAFTLIVSLFVHSAHAEELEDAMCLPEGVIVPDRPRREWTRGPAPESLSTDALPRVLVPINGAWVPEGRWGDEQGRMWPFREAELLLMGRDMDRWEAWRTLDRQVGDLRSTLAMGRIGNTTGVLSLLFMPFGGVMVPPTFTAPETLQAEKADLVEREAEALSAFGRLVCAYNRGEVFVPPPVPAVEEDPLDFDLFGDDRAEEE